MVKDSDTDNYKWKCNERLNNEKALMYLSLSVLSEEGYPSISALMSVVGPNNFIKMIRLFAGATFKMPTTMEWSTSLLTALYLYHKHIEILDDSTFFKLYEVDKNLVLGIKTRARNWERKMKDKGVNTKILLRKNLDV